MQSLCLRVASKVKGAAVDEKDAKKFLIDLGGEIADLKWVQPVQEFRDTKVWKPMLELET